MITIDISDQADLKWNKRLEDSNLGTIYQSAEIAQHFINIKQKPLFLKFIDGRGSIVGQLLLRESSYPNNRNIKTKLVKRFLRKQQLCQWSYGPLIFEDNFTNEIYQELGKFLLSKNYRVSGAEHPFCKGRTEKTMKEFTITKWATFIIDLTTPIDEIYQKISKHNGRKNIERSKKRGVIIEEINEKSLKEYLEMRDQMRTNSNEEKINHENFFSWWKLLKPLGYTGYIAKKDEDYVGGIMFSFYCGHIIEGGVARSTIDSENHLYSQDLIKWSIIEWGVKNKMKYYNLAGFNPHPKSTKEEGILRYKEKWGGKRFNYNLIRK